MIDKIKKIKSMMAEIEALEAELIIKRNLWKQGMEYKLEQLEKQECGL